MIRSLLGRRARWSLALVAAASLVAGAATGASVRQAAPSSETRVHETIAAAPARVKKSAGPIRRRRFGSDADSVVVAFRGRLRARRPATVFLHGWGVGISRYRGWIDHLVRAGNTVIAPRYQLDEHADPGTVREAALSGVQRALRRVRFQHGSLVFAGHSAGGALAADLAAEASAGRLPSPVAIYAVYPGRAILGYPAGIPAASLASLPHRTRLLALAGADDRIVAQAPAQQMVASATSLPDRRRHYALVRDPRVDDHFGPVRSGAGARRVFWARLDRLADRARR